jgi:hypothetical protein
MVTMEKVGKQNTQILILILYGRAKSVWTLQYIILKS